ncbi:uncharacterized protein LOC127871836 [Dreissena polymorpha]|uniref:Uncharacterized protein n=1 Tax=Dreissena polymorpha TaxID=45954 RepID=A0A9D4LIT1_DREPO|nr:uncharacterized protein LOC127871836 [Dreissena polymorpha]KAH3859343.1 hypothetical protein DPMN_102062 [Dreissena polymorpha]
MAEGSAVKIMNGGSDDSRLSPSLSPEAVTLGGVVHSIPSTSGTYIMPGPPHLKVDLRLNVSSKATNGQQHFRFGVVGNCHLLGDGEPQRARIGYQTSAQTWVVEIWVPANFVFEYRWVEFQRSTSFIFDIESIEPRRVEVGLRALEIRNKFNIPGGTFKEDIDHPVYFTSFCAPKRSLRISSLSTRRPSSPELAPAASKASSRSCEIVYSHAVFCQKRDQVSDKKIKTPNDAVDGEICVERENHTFIPASLSSSNDKTSDDRRDSFNIAATAGLKESVSTDSEVNISQSESSKRTSMTKGGVHLQTATSDFSNPSTSSSAETAPLKSCMHSLPSASRTYIQSDSLVARSCASTSAHSPLRRRHLASESAPDLGSCLPHSIIHHNMEALDALSHDHELTQCLSYLSADEIYNILHENDVHFRRENLTNGLKEYLNTTPVPHKRKSALRKMLTPLAWLGLGAGLCSLLRYILVSRSA